MFFWCYFYWPQICYITFAYFGFAGLFDILVFTQMLFGMFVAGLPKKKTSNMTITIPTLFSSNAWMLIYRVMLVLVTSSVFLW